MDNYIARFWEAVIGMQVIYMNLLCTFVYLFTHMRVKTIGSDSALLLKMCPLRSQLSINCETTIFSNSWGFFKVKIHSSNHI